jgi:hypothetical protein
MPPAPFLSMAPGLASETSINTVGLLFTLLMCLLLLAVPRRYAMVPVIILVCYMSMGQRVVVGGLNFTMIRILLCCGWLRVIVRGEWTRLSWNAVDKLVIVWTVVRTINYALVWGSTSALINRAGYAYTILGAYFLFRMLIRNADDVQRGLRYLAICIGPLAVLILMEKTTAHNPFAIFGGVPPIPEIRDGVLRCQGPFSHSILAGTFGATCVPLFVGLWLRQTRYAALAVLAVLSSMVLVVMGGSSGPVLAFGLGLLGLGLWPLRNWMRAVRWAMAVVLGILQVAMNAPVWFVIARLSVFSGSTGWFRGFLIDMTFRHFSEWWLIGSNQAPTWHPFLLDVTNQYVAEGLDGGLLSMVLFIAILGYSFRSVGRVACNRDTDRRLRLFAWSLGAALMGHVVSFISVAYFDQNAIVLYLLLASISVAGVASASSPARAETEPSPTASTPLAPWQEPSIFGGERYA